MHHTQTLEDGKVSFTSEPYPRLKREFAWLPPSVPVSLRGERYVWLLAKLLFNKKLSVVDGVTLMSHAQVSAKWKETDHTDPIEYLASRGKRGPI